MKRPRFMPLLVVVLASCQVERGKATAAIDSTAAATDTLAPSTPSVTTAAPVDEDSILDGMLPARITVTPAGDTLQDLGGGMIDEKYGVSYFTKNGVAYFRVQQLTGHMANGHAIWRTITRVSASKLEKDEDLMFAGLCGTTAGSDPAIIAIPRINQQDTAFTQIRRAWKFDVATETVREIPTSNIRCWSQGDD
jgi:hypothetical protein